MQMGSAGCKCPAVKTDRVTKVQAFVESKDGTKIPMFIVHRAGMQLDGTNPTLLYGYGGEPYRKSAVYLPRAA